MGFGLSTSSAFVAHPSFGTVSSGQPRFGLWSASWLRAYARPPSGEGHPPRRYGGGTREEHIVVERPPAGFIGHEPPNDNTPRRRATAALTRAWARNPPVGPRLVRVSDTAIGGFIAEVHPTGVVVFRVRYQDASGRRRDVRIGRLGEVTVDQARSRALEIRGLVSLGRDPAAERDRARAEPTVEEFAERQYIPHIRENLAAAEDYVRMLKMRILPAIGSMKLSAVRRQDIVELKAKMVAEGLSNGRTNRHLAVTRRLFSLALQWSAYEGRNPAEHPGMLREEPREVFLDGPQLRALVAALAAERNRTAAAALTLLLLTGCRRNEVLTARWEHADLAGARLLVPRAKGGKRRFVPLSRFAVELLAAQPRQPGQDFVFPSPRRPGAPMEGLKAAWQRVKAAAGLPRAVRLHDLRHTYASILINSGASLHTVSECLGHTQLATTRRYAHLANSTLVTAAGRVGLAAGLGLPAPSVDEAG